MASFDGVNLWSDAACGNRSGALLRLATKAKEDLAVKVGSGEIIARKGSTSLMVRGLSEVSFDECFLAAVDVANRGLDILAISGRGTLALADTEAENTVWIQTESGPALRIWSVSPLPMPTMRLQLQVRDASGEVKAQPTEPDPQWHEAFRYFRLAQATDDLYDAFRNLYLALEALLSTVAPQNLRPDGRPAEGEGAWFRRALTAATAGLEMHRYAAQGQAAATVDSLYDEIYVQTRTAVFHAKTNRSVVIPLDYPSRPAVLDTLRRLAQLVVDLAQHVVGIRFASSFWTAIAFRAAAEAILNGSTLYLTDSQDLNIQATSVYEVAENRVDAPTQPAPRYGESFRSVVASEFAGADIAQKLPCVGGAVIADNADKPMIGHTLEGRLQVDGIERVHVVIGVRGINTRTLKSDYAT